MTTATTSSPFIPKASFFRVLPANEDKMDRPPEVLWNTTGSSFAIRNLEEQMQQTLAGFIARWQNSVTKRAEIDVEQEVVVLLPPVRQRIVKVKLHHVGRAQPLISLDDAPELFQDS